MNHTQRIQLLRLLYKWRLNEWMGKGKTSIGWATEVRRKISTKFLLIPQISYFELPNFPTNFHTQSLNFVSFGNQFLNSSSVRFALTATETITGNANSKIGFRHKIEICYLMWNICSHSPQSLSFLPPSPPPTKMCICMMKNVYTISPFPLPCIYWPNGVDTLSVDEERNPSFREGDFCLASPY